VCYFLGNHIEAILSEDDFAAMYSATGRPGIHPLILAMVTVFQYLEKLPDRQASEQAVKRIDWKYALRQELTWLGFHYADLCTFRKRLLAHDASELVFEKLIQYLLGKGWLKSEACSARMRRTSSHRCSG
jgi:transposase